MFPTQMDDRACRAMAMDLSKPETPLKTAAGPSLHEQLVALRAELTVIKANFAAALLERDEAREEAKGLRLQLANAEKAILRLAARPNAKPEVRTMRPSDYQQFEIDPC